MHRITVLDASALGQNLKLNKLSDFGDLMIYKTSDDAEIEERLRESTIAVTCRTPIPAKALKKTKKLQFISIAGPDNSIINYKDAKSAKIALSSIPDIYSSARAQHTISMLLSLAGNIKFWDNYIKKKHFKASGFFSFPFKNNFLLQGKTWGIIEMNQTGKKTAELAQALGCKIIYTNPEGSPKDKRFKKTDLYSLLAASDIISVHCNYSEKTTELISLEEFGIIKPSSIIIGEGAGGVIDETALAQALDDQRLSGACLDHFQDEPLNDNSPIINIRDPDKVILSPGCGNLYRETMTHMVEELILNVKAYVNGEKRNRLL
jgi:glycerate dehydrogenase